MTETVVIETAIDSVVSEVHGRQTAPPFNTGPPGPPGPPGSGMPFVHVQVTPAAGWVVDHGSGSVFPDVEVFVDDQRVYPEIDYNSDVSLSVTFPSAQAGTVYVRT